MQRNKDVRSKHANAAVSVALCTHNGARFVTEQVKSILGQSHPVSEIVLSDDASTDNTVELIRHLVAEQERECGSAPNLKILLNDPPLGVRKNFEKAIEHCTGEFIALCDQDDVWHPDKVERMLDSFTTCETLLVFTDANLIDSASVEIGKTMFESQAYMGVTVQGDFDADPELCAVKRNVVTGATVMLKKELMELSGTFPEYCLHDEWLGLLAVANGSAFMLNECTIGYRQHENNQVGAPGKAGLKTFAQVSHISRAAEISQQKQRLVGMVSALLAAKVSNTRMLDLARAGIAFHEARERMPSRRLFRIPMILKLLARGEYSRFLSGSTSAIRDLIQAA